MSEEHDQLTGIFDDLTPEDFIVASVATSAVGFGQFVDANVEAMKKAYAASDGQMNIIAVLQADGREEIVPALDNETLYEYAARLREEAKSLGADRLFLCRRAQVGTALVEVEGTHRSIDDKSWVKENESALRDGVLYYAEQVDQGSRTRREARIGILCDAGGRLVNRTEIDARLQPIELFANMLS